MAKLGELNREKGPVVTIRCQTCGELAEAYRHNIARGRGKFCSTSCSARYYGRLRNPSLPRRPKGSPVPLWQTHTAGNGYRLIRVQTHPFADKQGYVYEHRLVAEMLLGRHLRQDEEIHHVDGDSTNNSPFNLIVFSGHQDHIRHHFGHKVDGIAFKPFLDNRFPSDA